jgi:hypothetical protein
VNFEKRGREEQRRRICWSVGRRRICESGPIWRSGGKRRICGRFGSAVSGRR